MTEIEASYITLVHHDTSDHQLQIGADIIVDFDSDGQVLGVERIGGTVDFGTLIAVIKRLRQEKR